MNRRYEIFIQESAREDIVGIWHYLAVNLMVPDIADEIVDGIEESISRLSFFPERYHMVDFESLSGRGIRRMLYKNYFIFYEIIEETATVNVFAVGYARRNWEKILTGGDDDDEP